MRKPISLISLKTGETAAVQGLSTQGAMRRRLQDIGLIPGAKVECVGISPLGDPAAYLICGAVIALRSEDAAGIFVEDIQGKPQESPQNLPAKSHNGAPLTE